ncbi:hypothetical protein QR680_016876 [Steinernema hermaphroditum]|uniref:G-protein coupled receptors family 1 profile domain-containing protein n=1 Tax=Steinernema hermaphroditum TaxID=289476 RepID=A0AA39HCK0_9BILA|nr:hypothetical protein QR680_016876 [Steinernema hermaphroditum]
MVPFTIEDYFLANKFVSVLIFLGGAVGVVGNLILFISIVRSQQLRSICAILVAIQALAEVVYPASLFLFVYVAYTEALWTRRMCLWVQFVPLTAANISIMMMPVVALDRFISLKAPIWYKRVNKRLFILCSLSVPVGYHILCTYLGLLYTTEDLVVCRLPDGYTQMAVFFWVGSQVCISLVVLVLYFFVRHELKKLKIQSKDVSTATNKSLQVIFIVYVCGYALFGFINGASMFIQDFYLFAILGSISGASALLNIMSPVFVFYRNSKLYRREIKSTLRFLLGRNEVKTITVRTTSSIY